MNPNPLIFRLGDLGKTDGSSPLPRPGSQSALLLEASAGTGKTYSLERMVLYLLVHPTHPLSLRQILMVTFTEAATQEIRERIRSLLFSYIHDDKVRSSLLGELGLTGQVKTDPETLRNLAGQLDQFSTAHIHTIHGFCSWVLGRHALEAGLDRTFSMDSEALEEGIMDWIRERMLPDAPWCLGDAIINDGTEKTLLIQSALELLGNSSADPDELPGLFAQLVSRSWLDGDLYHLDRTEVHRIWNRYFRDHTDLLLTLASENLSPKDPRFVEACARLADDFPSLVGPSGPLDLSELWGGKRGNPTKDSKVAFTKFALRIAGLHILDLMHQDYHDFISRRPDYLSRLSFNDLINRVHHLVSKDRTQTGDSVRTSLGQEFRAVLLDEFQDTDHRQWEIFHTLFSRGTLVAVGDPKQSIYGFRGADLGTYLRARTMFGPGGTRMLDRNFRSSAPLQTCINQIFGHAFGACRSPAHPLDCPEVKPGRPVDGGPFLVREGHQLAPVALLQPDTQEQKSSGQRRNALFQLVLEEIRSLLDGSWKLQTGVTDDPDSKPQALKAEDICILCENFKTAGRMRDLLGKASIPASIRGRGDLRTSREADELEVLFRCLQDPRDKGAVNALLMSRLGGISHQELQAFVRGPGMETLRSCLFRWKDELPRKGILPVFQSLVSGSHLDGTDLWARIFGAEGDSGLRTQTNFTHLTELFQVWCDDHPEALMRPGHGFRKFRTALSGTEETPLRLDRDRGAVCIMTQHASKGLEFPVVFALIGLGSASHINPGTKFELFDQEVLPGGEFRRCIDTFGLGKIDEPTKELIAKRSRQEKLRLYYVAATRAEALLYLPYLPWQDKKIKSPMIIEEWCTPKEPGGGHGIFAFPDTPEYRRVSETRGTLARIHAHQAPLNPVASGFPSVPESGAVPDTDGTPGPGLAGTGTAADYLTARNELLSALPVLEPDRLRNTEIGSFTSLKRRLEGVKTASVSPAGHDASGRNPSRDDEEAVLTNLADTPSQTRDSETRIPGGKYWGLAFHSFMQILDFGAFARAWDTDGNFGSFPWLADAVSTSLLSQGLKGPLLGTKAGDAIRGNRLCQEAHHVLSAVLQGLEPFTLADLAQKPEWADHRELDFQAIIKDHQKLAESISRITGHPDADQVISLAPGFLVGSIDLLFRTPDHRWHIIDWKTNTPPEAISGLAPDEQCQVMMDESAYHLQALIYQGVLKLHLDARGEGHRLGNVYYLFSRVGLEESLKTNGPAGSANSVLASRRTEQAIDTFIRESGITVATVRKGDAS